LTDTTAYVRLKENFVDKSTVLSAVNSSSTHRVMPYAQFKAMEATYGSAAATGVTPTMEKASISFSPFRNRFYEISFLQNRLRANFNPRIMKNYLFKVFLERNSYNGLQYSSIQ
jgi:hypothetical protein